MTHQYLILHSETISELEEWVEAHLNDGTGWYLIGGPFMKGQPICQALQRQVEDEE